MYCGNSIFIGENNLRTIKEEMAVVCILHIHDIDLHYCCKTLPRNYDLGLRTILLPCLGIRQLNAIRRNVGKQKSKFLLIISLDMAGITLQKNTGLSSQGYGRIGLTNTMHESVSSSFNLSWDCSNSSHVGFGPSVLLR